VRDTLGDDAVADLLDEVWRRSEGHALFITELVRDGLDRGAVVRGAEGWTLTAPLGPSAAVVDAIAERIRRLGPRAFDALLAVAVSEPLPSSVLGEVAPVDDLIALEDQGLLRARTERDRTVLALGHPLQGEAAV